LRLTSVRAITAVSSLLFGAAAWRVGPHSYSDFVIQAQTVQAQTAQTQPGAQVKPAVSSSSTSPPAASAPQLQPASVTTTSAKLIPEPRLAVPGGTELYTAQRGEAIPTVARHYLGRTAYLTSSELAQAIRAVNHKSESSNILKANEQIVIPGILPAPIVEHTIPVPKDFEVRAIYLTGVMAASDHGIRIIRHWREVGGNAVVFDIKDYDGLVNVPFDHPLAGEHKVYIHDVPKFVHFLHQQNMHAIARIAMFRDEHLVVNHPELAVQSRKNHIAWRENGKLVWTDPSNPKVQDYDIALAKHVAQLGVDEIQFDYVRFPAEGDQADAQFVFQNQAGVGTDAFVRPASEASASTPKPLSATNVSVSANQTAGNTTASASPNSSPQTASTDHSANPPALAASSSSPDGAGCDSPGRKPRVEEKTGNKSRRDGTKSVCRAPDAGPRIQRSDVITAFLKKAYAELHPTGVLLSLDVFGVMAWQRPVDLNHTGQDIVGMAHYCDVLSPMIYPSHFFGMDNIPHPGDEPAHFIGESMDRFELITKGSGATIRPWLQAFHWRTKTYSPEYIKIQVETARAKGGIGFLFWNAANDYSKPYEAMPEMKAANFKEASSQTRGQDNPRYFRGDEISTATVQAALTPAASASKP
jgi:hypothetical protein